jgi:hypothetical protein
MKTLFKTAWFRSIIRGYQFWCCESDLAEPPHVHIGMDGDEAKFWLNIFKIARTGRYGKLTGVASA